MRRRKGISFGTIAMLLVAVITLSSTLGLMLMIRRDEGDLTMDAEKLLDSVTELMQMSQRHIGDDQSVQMTSLVNITPAPAAAAERREETAIDDEHHTSEYVTTSAPQTVNSRHTVTMTFAGIVAFESAVLDGAYDEASEKYRYDELLSGISSAVHADLNFAVLKSLLTDGDVKTTDLTAPLGSVEALKQAGFDRMVLSTENALAGGKEAAEQTLSALRTSGIASTGVYMPENFSRYEMMQINGLQVAVLSYTESLSSQSKKAVADQGEQSAMIRLFSIDQACTDIADAKAQGAQAVLVFLNSGAADSTQPTSAQRKNAQALCDAGADILLMYSSKNVQPVEMLTSKTDDSHRMLACWSLGTLLAEDRATRGVVSGALIHVQLTYDEQTNALSFDKVEYTPTYCWRQEENGVYPYRVILSAQSVPEGMIQKQREIIARALVLIQTTMGKGIALQR